MSRKRSVVMIMWLASVAMLVSGCGNQTFMLGNVGSLAITCALLWSTLHLNRTGG